jgi:hypothetical protein
MWKKKSCAKITRRSSLDRRLLSQFPFVWRGTRPSFFLTPSPCKQFREQDLHLWRDKKDEKERKREKMCKTRITREKGEDGGRYGQREIKKRSKDLRGRTGHRRPSVRVNSSRGERSRASITCVTNLDDARWSFCLFPQVRSVSSSLSTCQRNHQRVSHPYFTLH